MVIGRSPGLKLNDQTVYLASPRLFCRVGVFLSDLLLKNAICLASVQLPGGDPSSFVIVGYTAIVECRPDAVARITSVVSDSQYPKKSSDLT